MIKHSHRYSENKHINVKGDKSPYDGDIAYWSERNSKLYDGETSKALKKQNHSCGHCGLKMLSEEKVHLHHVDGNHNNWKKNNLLAIHESCHDYLHMSKGASQEHREIERSVKGKGFGFDFWLGSIEDSDTLFQRKARLEVSGIRKGSEAIIQSRVNMKLKQISPSDIVAPGYVAVVEFGTPRVRVVEKCRT